MGRRCAKRFSGAVRTRWIQAIYAKKEQAAQSVAAKKIALVGGSSVHFSLSAAMMTEATGHPTINLGTHAGLGLQYLLHRAKESINRGDVVILAIEDPLFYSVRPTRLTAGYSLFFDRGFILNTSIQDAIKIVFGVQPLDVARQHVFYLAPWTDPAVHAKEMGASGDEGRNKAEAVSEEMKKVGGTFPLCVPLASSPRTPRPPSASSSRGLPIATSRSCTPGSAPMAAGL